MINCLLSIAFLLLSGCLLDFGKSTPAPPSLPAELQALDTLVAFGRISGNVPLVRLYYPVLNLEKDPDFEGDKKELVQAVLQEKGVRTGYIITGQEFGSWNAERELKWNLFHLQVSFFFRDRLPPDADTLHSLDTLFSRMHGIDRFTQYIDSANAAEADRIITTTGTPGAIGIRFGLTPTDDTLYVKQVTPGSPAGRSGIKKGMKILAVGDSSVLGDSAIALFQRYTQGNSGTALTLSLLEDGNVVSVSLRKEFVSFPSVLVDTLAGVVPQIQVFSFTPDTYDGKSTSIEFSQALAETENFPVTILDLRGNGGGMVSEALAMCDAIISKGVIIRQEIRILDKRLVPRLVESVAEARVGEAGEGRQYVLLADKNSASASEIFISALTEALDVPFIGDTTYGKGIAQVYIHTPGHGRVKITNSLFQTRNGHNYHLTGLYPDYPAPSGEALGKALELAQSLRGNPLARRGLPGRWEKEIALSELNRQERIRNGVEEMTTTPCGFAECP